MPSRVLRRSRAVGPRPSPSRTPTPEAPSPGTVSTGISKPGTAGELGGSPGLGRVEEGPGDVVEVRPLGDRQRKGPQFSKIPGPAPPPTHGWKKEWGGGDMTLWTAGGGFGNYPYHHSSPIVYGARNTGSTATDSLRDQPTRTSLSTTKATSFPFRWS